MSDDPRQPCRDCGRLCNPERMLEVRQDIDSVLGPIYQDSDGIRTTYIEPSRITPRIGKAVSLDNEWRMV